LNVEEVEQPRPRPRELLISVHATTVNRTDYGILTGKPYLIRAFAGLLKPRHRSTGTDFAGEVVSVGSAVTRFTVGQRVWGFNDNGLGTHAQYVALPEDEAILPVADTLTYEQAAACAEAAHYAYNFINKVPLRKGQSVLVNGGTGAIGSAAIQFLKYHGVQVTAVCATAHMELVKTLGADRVIDYLKEDFTRENAKYEFVFDAVGKSSFAKCKSLLTQGGVYLSTELGAGNENIYLPFTTAFADRKVIFPLPVNIKRSMAFVQKLVITQQFRPVIDRYYSLAQIREAFEYVASGQKIGNVILRPQQ